MILTRMTCKQPLPYEKRARMLEEAEYEVWKIQHETYATFPPDFWNRIAKEFAFFLDAFRISGFPPGYLSAIDNPYWPKVYRSSQMPWYEYRCALGWVQIGWRKRVISISWGFSPNAQAKIEVEDQVTHSYEHDRGTIHAWSEEKALEYLIKVRKSLQEATQGSTEP